MIQGAFISSAVRDYKNVIGMGMGVDDREPTKTFGEYVDDFPVGRESSRFGSTIRPSWW